LSWKRYTEDKLMRAKLGLVAESIPLTMAITSDLLAALQAAALWTAVLCVLPAIGKVRGIFMSNSKQRSKRTLFSKERRKLEAEMESINEENGELARSNARLQSENASLKQSVVELMSMVDKLDRSFTRRVRTWEMTIPGTCDLCLEGWNASLHVAAVGRNLYYHSNREVLERRLREMGLRIDLSPTDLETPYVGDGREDGVSYLPPSEEGEVDAEREDVDSLPPLTELPIPDYLPDHLAET